MESGGQDECFCYLDFFFFKLINFILEFGSKFGFSYKPQKQTKYHQKTHKETIKEKIILLLVSDTGKVFSKSAVKTSMLQFHERVHGQSVSD